MSCCSKHKHRCHNHHNHKHCSRRLRKLAKHTHVAGENCCRSHKNVFTC